MLTDGLNHICPFRSHCNLTYQYWGSICQSRKYCILTPHWRPIFQPRTHCILTNQLYPHICLLRTMRILTRPWPRYTYPPHNFGMLPRRLRRNNQDICRHHNLCILTSPSKQHTFHNRTTDKIRRQRQKNYRHYMQYIYHPNRSTYPLHKL
jgi:hypothetical protein